VRRQLVTSRADAVDLIEAGRVLVGGAVADKAARLVSPDQPISVSGPPARYVSRGGEKLEAALRQFRIDPSGKRVLDAGASTGGFTDCLLQLGAGLVVAVDVGRGQIHERVSMDARVLVRERTDIRSVDLDDVGGRPFDLVVGDLSFISLRTVAPALVGLAGPGSDIVVLIKPQFEAGRREASRGKGVIRDPQVWRRAVEGAIDALEAAGATMMGIMVSPRRGADGNVEFLAHFRAGSDRTGSATGPGWDLDFVLAQAVAGRES
jgi:23S rRNA (cytidine1920-2'-O)/16S rRNA (cytidine1409-2'-O)-methyltransferase